MMFMELARLDLCETATNSKEGKKLGLRQSTPSQMQITCISRQPQTGPVLSVNRSNQEFGQKLWFARMRSGQSSDKFEGALARLNPKFRQWQLVGNHIRTKHRASDPLPHLVALGPCFVLDNGPQVQSSVAVAKCNQISGSGWVASWTIGDTKIHHSGILE
jgi:hypothetical protein